MVEKNVHLEEKLYGWLYTFRIMHFASVFRQTPQNTKNSLYTFYVSCEFRVLLVLRKNEPQNPSSFCANADPGAKSEKKVRETQKKWREIPRYHTFRFCAHFRIFRDKCIAGLTGKLGLKIIFQNRRRVKNTVVRKMW